MSTDRHRWVQHKPDDAKLVYISGEERPTFVFIFSAVQEVHASRFLDLSNTKFKQVSNDNINVVDYCPPDPTKVSEGVSYVIF